MCAESRRQVAGWTSAADPRSARRFRASLELIDGVSMGYLKEGRRSVVSLMGLWRGESAEGAVPPAEAAARADVFLAINASSVELVDVERYCVECVRDRPLVLWNSELDTLRSDLGARRAPAPEQAAAAGEPAPAACTTRSIRLLAERAIGAPRHPGPVRRLRDPRGTPSTAASQRACRRRSCAEGGAAQACSRAAGLLGFPSKDLQFRFLSTFTPVFYIRQRDYSKVRARRPYL